MSAPSTPKKKEPKYYDTPLPHTIPAHLPLPGKSPDWPYINIGKWKIDVNNYAQSWRDKSREEQLRARVATDGHAPARWRAMTVRNLDAWYPAFNVQKGEKLYLAPDKRVKVW